MAYLIFKTAGAPVAFSAIVEGMAEVCIDEARHHAATGDGSDAAAALAVGEALARLGAALAQHTDHERPLRIEDRDAPHARNVIESCVRNAEDEDAEDDNVIYAGDAMVLDSETPTPADALEDLLAWASNTGGWDAPEWRRARETLALLHIEGAAS